MPEAAEDSDSEFDNATFSDLIAREKAPLDSALEQPAGVEVEAGAGDDEAAASLGLLDDDEVEREDVCIVERGPEAEAGLEEPVPVEVPNEVDSIQDEDEVGLYGGEDGRSSGEESDDLDYEYLRL